MLKGLARIAALVSVAELWLGCARTSFGGTTPCRPCAGLSAPARAEPTPSAPTHSELATTPSWQVLLEPPNPDAPCRVTGSVHYADVHWRVRTRLDAVPSFVVHTGTVTALLFEDWRVRHDGPVALVQVDNDVLTARGLVVQADLRFVFNSARLVDSAIPGGATDHPLYTVDGDQVSLGFERPQGGETLVYAPCSALGLARKELAPSSAEPPSLGARVISQRAKLRLRDGSEVSASQLRTLLGEDSVHVELLDGDPSSPSVAIHTCGGTLLAKVARRELRPEPGIGHGTNAHCPNTGDHEFMNPELLSHLRQCEHALPVFIRTGTLEDQVAVLKAHALFQLDEATASGETLAVSIAGSPIRPIGLAKLVLRAADIARCVAVPGTAPSALEPELLTSP
ncbi:MAG TPA: hypothetical protein VGL19_22070 [Polyangiaceae bacterium]